MDKKEIIKKIKENNAKMNEVMFSGKPNRRIIYQISEENRVLVHKLVEIIKSENEYN